MSVSEVLQSKETQDLLKRVADIENRRYGETETVTFMPLFGMYAPTDTSITAGEELESFISERKDMIADYERGIVNSYDYSFVGSSDWHNEQESRYRTRLTNYLSQHEHDYNSVETLCYLAEMKARYINVDNLDIPKTATIDETRAIVSDYAGITDFVSLSYNDYIILDTETTGFSQTDDDVIELGITDINGNVLYDGMFKPDRENSPEAESANYISNAELQDKPTIFDEWEKIKTAVAGRKIATYNLDFDKNIMINAAVRHGIPREEIERMFDNSVCIMQSYTAYKNGYRATKLQNALTENGIEVTQDHRAVSDCKVTAQLIQTIREQIRDKEQLDRAFQLIAEYSSQEFELNYDEELSDLRNATTEQLHDIGLAYTTHPELPDEIPVETTADLIDLKITYTFNGEVYKVDTYESIEEMCGELQYLDFSELTNVPDEIIERYLAEQQNSNVQNKNEESREDNMNTYSIYQLKEESLREYGFMSYSKNKGKVTFNNYNLVYQGNLNDIKSDNDFAKLNYVYNMFNLNHPEDFKGHSLSMSDVVVFSNGNEEQAYYVDRFGFAEIPEFIQQKNRESLENAVESIEQDKPKEIVITDRSAAIESTDDVPSRPDFHSLNGMDLYRIIIPNETQTKAIPLNNVTYPDIESARNELKRLGYEEVAYDDMINIVGENMTQQNERFAKIFETQRPTVHVEWSEHPEIKENSDYSLSEFSHLMERLEKEWIEKRESGDQNYEGYAKTKFDIYNVYGGVYGGLGEESEIIGTINCRQDIGDGDGSIANHVRLVAESDLAMLDNWGRENVSNYEELERSAHTRINIVSPYIEYAVCREDMERQAELNRETAATKESSIVQNDKPEPQTLMSAKKSGETRYYTTEHSADDILKATQSKQPLPVLSEMGNEISSAEYAEIQQSDRFTVAVEMDFDNDSASIYTVNDGKGGISEGDRTDENMKITQIKLSEYGKEPNEILFDNGIQLCSYEYEHNDGDQMWEDSTEFRFNPDDKSIWVKEYEGYNGSVSIERCTSNDVLQRFELADREAEKRRMFSERYNAEKDNSYYISARSGYVINQEIEDTVREYLKNNDLDGLKNHLNGKDSERSEENYNQEQSPEPQKQEKQENEFIGNTPYRFIKDKTYINTTATAAREVAALFEKNDFKFSGIIKGDLGTITVAKDKYETAMNMIYTAKIDLHKTQKTEQHESEKPLLDNKKAVDTYVKDQISKIMDSKNFIDFCKSDSLFLFRKYSLNNALLIIGQKENAAYCCSAKQWQQFGRIVNKGEHGLKILVPNYLKENNKGSFWRQIKKDIADSFDKQKGYGVARLYNTDVTITGYNGLYDVNFKGKTVISKSDESLVKKWIDRNLLNKTVIGYSIGTVFDVSQTNTNTDYVWLKAGTFDKKDLIYSENGKPIQNKALEYKVRNTEERKNSFKAHLSAKIDPQDKEKMSQLYDILKEVSKKTRNCPVYETTADKDNELKKAYGYYNVSSNNIVIREDMEITKKVSVLLHEMAHSEMHNLTEQLKDKPKKEEAEIQAEAVACIVANNFGIDTETSSFTYISHFVESRNLDYLEKSLNTIWNGSRTLFSKIEKEINERGLDLSLEPTKAPFTKEQISDIVKNYSEIVTEIKALTQENIQNALNDYKRSVVDEIKEYKKDELAIYDKISDECKAIATDTEKLSNATERAEQDRLIEKIQTGFDRMTVLTADTSEIENAIKEIHAPETPQQEFLSYPINYMNRESEVFKNVSEQDKNIIARSKFIADNYSYLLNNAPSEFVKYATQQADNIRNTMSKNGTAVEIINSENYGTKTVVESGMVMHPVTAEKMFKKLEAEVGLAKIKAERNGGYFPSVKTDLTIYSEVDTIKAKGLTAINTSMYLGNDMQKGLADHIEKTSKGKGLVRAEICDNFFDAQKEVRGNIERLYRAEMPPKQREQENSTTLSLEQWREKAITSKSERDNELNKEQGEQEKSDKSDRKSSEPSIDDIFK